MISRLPTEEDINKLVETLETNLDKKILKKTALALRKLALKRMGDKAAEIVVGSLKKYKLNAENRYWLAFALRKLSVEGFGSIGTLEELLHAEQDDKVRSQIHIGLLCFQAKNIKRL